MATKVMIVDDSRTIREVVSTTLDAAGYEVVEAFDGSDALSKLVGVAAIALVICDINMPRMTGLEFLRLAHADARRRRVPVVMMTNEVEGRMLELARRAGASGWLAKPVKPDLLLAAVRTLVGAA